MTRSINDKESTNKDPADLIAGYVLGNLTAKEAEYFQQQLNEKPELLKEVAAFQAAADLLPHALPKMEPSTDLKSKLLAAASQLSADQSSASEPASTHIIPRAKSSISTNASISEESDATTRSKVTAKRSHLIPTRKPPSPQDSQRDSTFDRWLSRWLSNGLLTGVSTGVAAIAIAAMVSTAGKLSDQTRKTASLQQQLDNKTAEVADLRAQLQEIQAVTAFLGERATQVHALVDAKEAAIKIRENNETDSPEIDNSEITSEPILPTARLLAKVGEREIVFVAQDLPQLPSEQIYRLWAVADEEADPMYCGQFRQDDSGTARWQAPSVACTNAPAQLLITLDAPEDPITSAGPLVLKTQVESEI